jgi:hypothetical protein
VVSVAIFVGRVLFLLCSPSTNYVLHLFADRFNDGRDTTMLLERYPLYLLITLMIYAHNDYLFLI